MKKMKQTFIFLYLGIPSIVLAEEETASLMEPLSVGSMVQVLAGLAAVLLLFGGIVFLLKRMGGFRPNQAGKMRIVDGVSVGTRDRVLLMQVGEKQVLIGISSNGISRLAVFDEAVISEPEVTSANGFAGQLQRQIKNRLSPEQKPSSDQAKDPS